MALTLVSMVAALVFSLLRPSYFDASLSFSINRTSRQETAEYQYDGYYAIQAADLFSQTVMSWLMTPSVLLEIYQTAGINPNISSLEELSSRFKTRQYSAQNIVVRYKERDFSSSENIGTAITNIIQEKSQVANQDADQKSLFSVVGSKPVIVEREPAIALNTLIGLVAGLIVSLLAAYVLEYIRTGEIS